jgi:hypothetical protein
MEWMGEERGWGNHGEAVYIIKAKPCISSIPNELHLIKPQIYTLKRDDIQKRRISAFFDDIPPFSG